MLSVGWATCIYSVEDLFYLHLLQLTYYMNMNMNMIYYLMYTQNFSTREAITVRKMTILDGALLKVSLCGGAW